MLCALCFVLRAHAFCLSGFLVTACQARSTKHEACAGSRWPHAHGADCQQQQADTPAHKNRVFLSRMAKHKAQSMSTKQPILTKICDFEHKARITKHKALSMSTKQRQKNWAQYFGIRVFSLSRKIVDEIRIRIRRVPDSCHH
jgi:hypothetical protein